MNKSHDRPNMATLLPPNALNMDNMLAAPLWQWVAAEFDRGGAAERGSP